MPVFPFFVTKPWNGEVGPHPIPAPAMPKPVHKPKLMPKPMPMPYPMLNPMPYPRGESVARDVRRKLGVNTRCGTGQLLALNMLTNAVPWQGSDMRTMMWTPFLDRRDVVYESIKIVENGVRGSRLIRRHTLTETSPSACYMPCACGVYLPSQCRHRKKDSVSKIHESRIDHILVTH